MILHHDIQPIDHVSPRPRIDLNARVLQQHAPETTAEVCARLDRTARGHRIWGIIVDAATGTNVAAKERAE